MLADMSAANVVIGLVMGLPMMIVVGPISVLLLDQGLERGVRGAAPAAVGVAGADLTLATLAALGGSSLTGSLGPFTPVLTLIAVVVLLVIAAGMGRSALVELRSASERSRIGADRADREPELHRLPALAPVGATARGGAASGAPSPSEGRTTGSAFARLVGPRLAAAFYGVTLVNPLTLVLFASVVVAGGRGVGTIGWALGMALSSLLAHGGFVVVGGALGTRLGPVASGRLRLGAAAFMGLLALWFAMGR